MEPVTVLLATYNGEQFLDEQMASLAEQTWPSIDLVVSDDGSTDATLHILDRWAGSWRKGAFQTVSGPQQGFAANFRSLITTAPVQRGYFAFCDQDDVWLPGKLEKAIGIISGYSTGVPALYCSRTRLFPSENGHDLSPLFARPPSFLNALVQSIGGGNTMVMNEAAFSILQESCRRTVFVSHDWWAYLIVTGAGGVVHYDPEPEILYRQHAGNLVGNNSSIAARYDRLKMLLGGQFRRWMDENLSGLHACSDLLTMEARDQIASFEEARHGKLVKRLHRLADARVYRQTREGQISLALACMLNRL